MESLLLPFWHLIVFLVEIVIILLLLDAILGIICSMFNFSWKKVLLWAATIFGILWLRDFLIKHKENAKKEIINDLHENNFVPTNEENK